MQRKINNYQQPKIKVLNVKFTDIITTSPCDRDACLGQNLSDYGICIENILSQEKLN